MDKSSQAFLFELLETPSPSGFEQKIQRVVKKYVSGFATTKIDVHGNLIASVNEAAPIKLMLAGHCDQIGLMITHIDEKGYIYFNQIGGIDASVLLGMRVKIAHEDKVIPGVIGHKPVHLIAPADRGKTVELNKLWIDCGFSDGKEAKKYLEVGDPITFNLGVELLRGTKINSPGCDNKVGAFTVMQALKYFSESLEKNKKLKCPVALYAVSTVQEEIGLRGAKTSCFGIDPLLGIAVDVTHASDNPGAEAKQVGTVVLGGGPTVVKGANYNQPLVDLITATAKKKKIKYQPHFAPGATGTDANVIQTSRSGVATAGLGIPNRYMHTPIEIVDLNDLDYAARLICETALEVTTKMSFIPS